MKLIDRERYKGSLTEIKEAITGKKSTKDDFIEKFEIVNKATQKPHAKYSKNEKIVFWMIGATLLNSIVLAARYIYAYYNLKPVVLCNSIIYLLPAIIIPFMAWAIATNENFFAFHQRKRVFFYLCIINAALVLLQPIYSVIRLATVPTVMKIPTNPALTEKMVLLLAYILMLGIFTTAVLFIYRQIEPVLLSDTTKRQIELFKLQQIIDNRDSRQYKYDATSIKSLETGKPIRIKENDRFVHTALIGSSGTGKTSTIFGGIILSDLKQKVMNREKRQEEYMNLITLKKATLQGPLKEFREDAVVPIGKNKLEYRKNQKAIETIKKKYPDCGMTIVAPNPSLMEDIIKMCEARDIDVDIIDPVYHYTQYKNVHEVGINPFYVPFGLEESERVIWISNAASVFSEVLIATNQMGGQGDQYFTDISLSVSSNVASIVMLANNIKGKQTYFDDVADCISNFDNLKPYIQTVEEFYSIHVVASSTQKKNIQETYENLINAGNGTTEISEDAKKNPYYQQILFIKQELIGDGKEAMFSQARGLRNLLTKIVQDPRIKAKLSCKDEDRLNFDESLKNNSITVVSTAIELGQSISTSFGLFFLLLHRTSVLRRPIATRTPHFLWIDECSQYCHPFMDDAISLYRQYRCAVTLTLQSLLQFEKNPSTAFLKGVIMGAGTHIVFGRLGVEEMEIYSQMAGVTRELQEQRSRTSNSVLSSNPSYTESIRETPTITNNMEGADLRMLDFLELTIYTIDAGRVLPGQFGRAFFIGEDAFDRQETRTFLWEKAVPEAFTDEPNMVNNPLAEDEREESSVKTTVPISQAEEILTAEDEIQNPLLEAADKQQIPTKAPAADANADAGGTPKQEEESKNTSEVKTEKDEEQGEDISIGDFYKNLMGIK